MLKPSDGALEDNEGLLNKQVDSNNNNNNLQTSLNNTRLLRKHISPLFFPSPVLALVGNEYMYYIANSLTIYIPDSFGVWFQFWVSVVYGYKKNMLLYLSLHLIQL